jgi:signal transduction histidine kinase
MPLGAMTESPGPGRTPLQPPDDITRGLFGRSRHLVRTHPLATDTLLAIVLLTLSTVWLAGSTFASLHNAVLQTGVVAPLALRRVWPSAVFVLISLIAFAQWLLDVPLVGAGALLIALYTVAAHRSWIQAAAAALISEAGAAMAAILWAPAGPTPRSLLFLTATVVAALFAGLTAASGSRYLAWMDERARRLEVERDQQATISAAAERTRIARELHDIVSHSLSVVITLADAAAVVGRTDPAHGAEAMTEVSEVGRHALSDMRAMLGVLRPDEHPTGQGPASYGQASYGQASYGQASHGGPPGHGGSPGYGPAPGLAPQPGLDQLDALVERVRGTGLLVDLTTEGAPFPVGAAAEMTAYRIVQEALTNTLRHAAARHAWITIRYHAGQLQVRIADDGTALPDAGHGHRGHGLDGMRERAALHDGVLQAGPAAGGGWLVSATLWPSPARPPATMPA